MTTYTTTLAIGPVRFSLDTASAELYAAQQRAYQAFASDPAAPSRHFRLRFDFHSGGRVSRLAL